jgi:hypothetical protein
MDKFLETHHELVEGTKIPEKVNPKDQKVKPSTAKKSGLSTTSSVMGKSQVSFKK